MTGQTLPSRHWRAELALAGIAMIWGSTFVLVKTALADVSTVLFVAIRFSLAAVVLFLIQLGRGGFRSGNWIGGAITGAVLCSGYLFQTVGLRWTTPTKSGFITGLYIVIVPVLGSLLLRKPLGAREFSGAAIATVGLGLLSLNSSNWGIGTGDLLTVGCAFAFSVHILLLAHFSKREAAGLLALQQISACAAVAWLAVPVIEAPFVQWTATVWAALLITSVFATALAFYVQTWGQSHTSPTRAALIFALEPVFSWATSFLFLGEVLTGRAVAGVVCILAGIVVVELKPAVAEPHPLI